MIPSEFSSPARGKCSLSSSPLTLHRILKEFKRRFGLLLEHDDDSAIPSDLRSSIYRNSVRLGGEKEYKKVRCGREHSCLSLSDLTSPFRSSTCTVRLPHQRTNSLRWLPWANLAIPHSSVVPSLSQGQKKSRHRMFAPSTATLRRTRSANAPCGTSSKSTTTRSLHV